MAIRRAIRLVLAFAALGTASCTPSPTSPSNSAPFSQTDLREGMGNAAVAGNTLAVSYVGWLHEASKPDGKGPQFEASTEPFTFILGGGQVIAGWDQGLTGMQAGGLRRLVIPPSLAYGGNRRGSIPPNSTLVFEVELLNIE